MKWISEETLRDCQIFRYSKMENGKEGVIPVKVEDLPGIEMEVIADVVMATELNICEIKRGNEVGEKILCDSQR